MRIAVVGSGISGLVCAERLAGAHEVVLFERRGRLGGHTNTVIVQHEARSIPVDTGFIVFNERNYPNFCALLDRLGVGSRKTTMSFSVRDDATGFEFGGASLVGIVGSAGNLLRPRWWRVVQGVRRLGAVGKQMLAEVGDDETVGDLDRSGRFSRGFLDDYLVPMAASIWSTPVDAFMEFPAKFFLRFFDNHGMLDLRERPQWRTVVGGSRSYIDAMLGVIGPSVRTGAAVEAITRRGDGVEVSVSGGSERFDHVIIAAHADQALAMLGDPTGAEREILSAMPYQRNDTVLHTDASLLPRRRRCWAAWNYRRGSDPARPVAVTYNMTMLQGLDTAAPICVTLNDTGSVDPAKIIDRFDYHHPVYTVAGERARARWSEISGTDQRTHYCGAYWGNGFHEDGVVSALRVCSSLGVAS